MIEKNLISVEVRTPHEVPDGDPLGNPGQFRQSRPFDLNQLH